MGLAVVESGMTTQDEVRFAVRAKANGIDKAMTMRSFADHDGAAAYALKADMSLWDDVWVERVVMKAKGAFSAPPEPWTVEWVGGFAYLVAANGEKLASLLGSQEKREYVAGKIIDAFGKTK